MIYRSLLNLAYILSNLLLIVFFRHDERTAMRNNRSSSASTSGVTPSPASSPVQSRLITQQFGVSLQFIKDNHGGEVIPPIMRQCIEFLSQPDGLY